MLVGIVILDISLKFSILSIHTTFKISPSLNLNPIWALDILPAVMLPNEEHNHLEINLSGE